MSIRNFIDQFEEQCYFERAKTSADPEPIDWISLLEQQSYIKVSIERKLYSRYEWQELINWCTGNIGIDHYCFTGNYFWFESAEIATLFSLRWVQ